MARSTRLVILTKNIYTLWGRKRFLLPVKYFPTNLVYPFTLRVTGIKLKLVCQKAFKFILTDCFYINIKTLLCLSVFGRFIYSRTKKKTIHNYFFKYFLTFKVSGNDFFPFFTAYRDFS